MEAFNQAMAAMYTGQDPTQRKAVRFELFI